MTWKSCLVALLLIVGSCHGSPAPNRMSSRVQERAGGFMEFGDIPGRLRGVCKTVLGIESVLSTFPLSLVSGVVFSIPLPIPNPLILDPLRLYEFSTEVMTRIQDTINDMTGEPAKSRKRDLSSLLRSEELEGVQTQLLNIGERMKAAFKLFNIQRRSLTEREAEDPGKPGYLLNLRNILDIVEYLCPLVDLTESFFKTSFIGFLNLYRIPLPIPDGTPINVFKAMDIWNIGGAVENLASSVSNIFTGGAPVATTAAPSASFLSGLFGGSSVVATTTPAPGLLQGAINSIGNLFGGIFGGGAAPAEPESAAAIAQNDEVMEVPEEPQVMVAFAPAKPTNPVSATTAAPAKLTGSILGVNVDWLFGNDSAKPMIVPTTIGASNVTTTASSSAKASTTTAASQTGKVIEPTTKAPVSIILDALFGGSSPVITSTSKPSTAENPPARMAPTTSTVKPTTASVAATVAPTSTAKPVIATTASATSRAIMPQTSPSANVVSTTTTTAKPSGSSFLGGIFGR